MKRTSKPLENVHRTWVLVKGQKLNYFSGCDYYRLSAHPLVQSVLRQAIKEFGVNVAASRLTTGNHRLYEMLEEQLAKFFAAESALLVSSGYMANLAAAQALAGEYSHALIDEKAHASLHDAAAFLNCPLLKFQHRSPDHLADVLGRLGKLVRPIVLTDGMFSHDGSVAPLKRYLRCMPKDGLILVDDAHGAGIIGRTGKGTPEHEGVPRARIVQTITLSKALGLYGGAVLGARKQIGLIIEKSHLFAGNTPMPLPWAAAAQTALELLREPSKLRRSLRENCEQVKAPLRRYAIPSAFTPGPVISWFPQDVAEAERLSRTLLEAKIYPPLVKYPGAPANGYLRFAISSAHSSQQLRQLINTISKIASAGSLGAPSP